MDIQLIHLPKIHDARGNMTVIEGKTLPFAIQRVYYLYDVEGGATRAGHAHKTLEQVLIAISGSFDVLLDDGERQVHYTLNRSYQGLYIPPGVWRVLNNFSSGAVCLALVSAPYAEKDYIRDYAAFLEAVHG